MDHELDKLLKEKGLEDTESLDFELSTSSANACVVIQTKEDSIEYALKPLNQLYAPNSGRTSLNTEDTGDLALLMCIESAIVQYYGVDPDLTDGMVELALDRLDMNPAGDPGKDRVAEQIQLRLRLQLSMSDYSLQEVRLAIRKVRKSVQRHTCRSGRTGYLDFIRSQFTRQA